MTMMASVVLAKWPPAVIDVFGGLKADVFHEHRSLVCQSVENWPSLVESLGARGANPQDGRRRFCSRTGARSELRNALPARYCLRRLVQ